jgi:GrpB-like predicted nucleotidyltransferase (UPF0157 family)
MWAQHQPNRNDRNARPCAVTNRSARTATHIVSEDVAKLFENYRECVRHILISKWSAFPIRPLPLKPEDFFAMLENESLQRAIDEPVRLVPYDPSWPRFFEQEEARLHGICPEAFERIEHIGSTAVPMLSAKPVIDLMAGVPSLARADAILPILCANGYTTSAEFNATLVDSRWLMRHSEGRRTHHLHLMIFDGVGWRKRLRFRDALRVNAEIRGRYEDLKAKLVEEAGADREAYTAMKTGFIEETLERTAD